LLVNGYFATAFRDLMDQPSIYWHLGSVALVIAWAFISVGVYRLAMLI
jgi:hypothetical protein